MRNMDAVRRYSRWKWAVQDGLGKVTVYDFATEAERGKWILENPSRRRAVGLRDPRVSAFRKAKEEA